MSDTEKLCEQIEKLCEYLAAVSEAKGASMWSTVSSTSRIAEMSAVLQGDMELLERVKKAPRATEEEALEWLDTSDAGDAGSVIDLVLKCFRAVYYAYLDGEKYRLLYDVNGGLHYPTPYSKPKSGECKVVAVACPDATPLSPKEATEKIDSRFKEHRALFVKQLQIIAVAERELRRNAAVQRVGCEK